MNTKTNNEYASNSYSGGIMGSDSPAALLDMLAEVASQTLHSEKKRTKSLLASQCKSRTDFTKRRPQETSFNVPQLLAMPASQLVKQFSIFTSDELKRQYSYTCALIVGCGQKYTSFASEGKARMSIKAHLAEHLEYLKTNKEAYNSFIAKSINYKNIKTGAQNKKGRLQQSKKPQETLNKENKNIIVEKSTNYLRNIFLNDVSFKELDKTKNSEKPGHTKKLHNNSEHKDSDRIDFKVLGDHSYFERVKDEMPNGKATTSLNNVFENTTADENIVLMVVGADSVHMKEYSHINQKLSENVNHDIETVYLPEMSWSDEICNKSMEISTTTKPKGKAKFIGTSKEEREMALAFMDRIKKKGNPTGSNLECRICNPPRSFTAPTTLVSHYRSHAGIKPYECRICRAVFTRRHSLKYHMLIHQNQTRFTCADCGKKFRHPSHFREHRRRHTGEAPFGCDDCGQRFKTRNTYKRHLKTRHGKVLTTTGELLYLSEEDFQKVRTHRKKKTDFRKEHAIDEDVIAAKTIMEYGNYINEEHYINEPSEEYTINENTDNSNRNWEMNGTIQIIKKCFETYEVCSESHLNKTETIETEIPVDNRVSDKNGNTVLDEHAEKVQGSLSQLQSASYDCSERVQDDHDRIVCHDNIEDQSELIYHNVNETPSYIQVAYNSAVSDSKDDSNIVECGNTIEILGSQIEDHIQVVQHTENERHLEYIHSTEEVEAQSIEFNTHIERQSEKCNNQIIFTQDHIEYEEEEEQEEDCIGIDSETCEEMNTNEISVIENLIDDENILETVNQLNDNNLSSTKEPLETLSKDQILEEDKELNNYQNVTGLMKDNRTEQNRKHLSYQIKQQLYVNNEPLTGIIVQNKCINIIPREFVGSQEQQNELKTQLNKGHKFTLLHKPAKAINIKQNGKQGAILLLANDTLKGNIFRIDQNNTIHKEVKKEILERSK